MSVETAPYFEFFQTFFFAYSNSHLYINSKNQGVVQ